MKTESFVTTADTASGKEMKKHYIHIVTVKLIKDILAMERLWDSGADNGRKRRRKEIRNARNGEF